MTARVKVGDRVRLLRTKYYPGTYPVVGVVLGHGGHVEAVQVDVGRDDGHLRADAWNVEVVT